MKIMKNRNPAFHKALSLFLLAALIFALCACGTASTPEATPTPEPTATPTPAPTPEPTPEPDPETVDATVKTAELKMVYTTLSRGDLVNITGETEDGQYAIVTDTDGDEFYALRAYLRTEDDEPFAGEWLGYAVSNAEMFSTAFLEGEPLTTLAQNSELQVLDELNGIVYCTYQPAGAEPITGYLSSEDVKTELIQAYWGWDGGGDYGGGGGDAGGGASYSDGADIVLGYHAEEQPVLTLLAAESLPGKEGRVFTDGLEIYAGIAEKGDTVQLIAKDNDEEWTVLVNHLVCTIPAKSVRVVGEDEPFEEFTGWVAEGGGSLYDNEELKGDPILFTVNVQLQVLDQIGDVYYVEVTENSVKQCGMTGYIKVEEVSDSITVIQYGGWGDYGGDSGGSGGGSEWSGDVM